MKNAKLRITTVVGARPQFVKAAVFSRELSRLGDSSPITETLVHTGQHYDPKLSDIFFQDLQIPAPKHMLEVGSGTAAHQMSRLIERLGAVLKEDRPDAVLVYGDTNSTLAAAVASAHLDIPLIHAEAGERIFRRKAVPEEPNRVATDHLAALCLTATRRAQNYLLREGMARQRVSFVGDLMYDLFVWATGRAEKDARVRPETFGLEKGKYVLATIHRAQNTTSRDILVPLLESLDQCRSPVVLPVHPRVRNLLAGWAWSPKQNLRLIEPLGYFDMVNFLLSCRVCFTDSGGVTREAFFARKPCIIPMEGSWWTDIVESGWAIETGLNQKLIRSALSDFTVPDKWPENLFGDGDSAGAMTRAISAFFSTRPEESAWHPHGFPKDLPPAKPSAMTFGAFEEGMRALKASGYRFASFSQAESLTAAGERFVCMRHDIDLDVSRALRMAELEAGLGVQATYFFMLRTVHYNLLAPEETAAVSRILALGHKLGLHFDCAAYPDGSTVDALAAACRREARLLEDWFGTKVDIVSYHRPNKFVLSGEPALSSPLPHTYMPFFNTQMRYFSDSRGEWRSDPPWSKKVLRDGYPLHVLIHPIWWNSDGKSPYGALTDLASEKFEKLETSIAANCTVYRVGWLNRKYELE